MAYREIQDLGIYGYDVDDFEIKDGVVLGSPFDPGDTLVIPDKDNEGNPVIEIKELDPNTKSRGFKAVVIPDTVKKIEKEAFNGCKNLAEIHIPASVESIAEGFASWCPSLKKITVDSANKYYDSRNNCNAIVCKKNNTLIQGCCNTVIPEGVEVVGKKAFGGQDNLKFIAIPNSVKKISDFAFSLCNNLINILIPEGVVEIGEYAFDNCTSLVSIYLPDSVKTVATHAFEKCDELVFMRIPSDVEIDKDAFFYVSDRQRLILTDRKMAAKLINKFPDFTENAFFRLTYENITDSSCCNYDFFKANDIIEQEEQSKKIYENFKDSLMKKLGLNGTGEHNGHVYVDLGLPSGTKWATYNIGTSTFEEIGDCFAWGETEVCENVDDLEDDNYMYEDNPSVLPASADVASVKWGEGWRMPTKGEFEELINNCTYKWTEMLGAKGWLFTGTNGNSIFLPAYETKECCDLGPAGFYGTYWSSSLNTAEPNCAWYLYLSENNVDISEYLRVRGLLIRPVCSINE